MSRGIINFVSENLLQPLLGNSISLNPINTLIYSAFIAVLATFLISRIRNSDFEITERFFITSTPLMILTGLISGTNLGNNTIPNSPIYSILIATTIASAIFYISLELDKRGYIDFNKTLILIPALGTLVLIFHLRLSHEMVELLKLVALWSSAGYLFLRFQSRGFFKVEFAYPIFAHFLDASTTFLAINSGAREKVFLGRFFIEIFGPIGIFILKTVVIIPLTYYLFAKSEAKENLYYLYFITVLGMVLSARNFAGL